MSNTLAPFGFRHIGTKEGYAPTFGMTMRRIALGNTNPIGHGDPVATISTGYIQQASTNGTTGVTSIAGIFQGCEYYSISQQRKVRSNYWPGSDAQYDPVAFIIDTPNALFYVQSNGSPITFGNIGNNVGYFIATGSVTATGSTGQVNSVTQLSGAMLDVAGSNSGGSGAVGTATTLPFRIVGLYSDLISNINSTGSYIGLPNSFGAPVVNGVDNASNYNWAVVTFNNVDTKSQTGV
jgi:hypothetical protein